MAREWGQAWFFASRGPRGDRDLGPRGTRPGSGFTLIELIVALAIIGVLAAIAWPSYSNWQEREGMTAGVNHLQKVLGAARARSVQNGLECGQVPDPAGGGGDCTSLYYGMRLVPGNPDQLQLIRFCDDDGQACNGAGPGGAVQPGELATLWTRNLSSWVTITPNTNLPLIGGNFRVFFNKSGAVYGNSGSIFLAGASGGNNACVAIGPSTGRFREGTVNVTTGNCN